MAPEAAAPTRQENRVLDWVRSALAGAHLIAWWLAAALFHTAPGREMAEGLAVGAEWTFGTFRDPPLLSWLLEIFWDAAGYTGIALLAALPMAASYLLLWELARRVLPARQAMVGLLLSAGVLWLTWPTAELSPSLLAVPFWLAALVFLWDCFARPRTWRWIALGLLAALARYASYSAIELVLAVVIWVAASRNARSLGAVWAVMAFVIAVSPMAYWLIQTNFLPLDYVQSKPWFGIGELAVFIGAQLLALVPLAVLILLAGPSMRSFRSEPTSDGDRFILFFATIPLALIFLGAIITKSLSPTLAAPALSVAGLLAARLWTSEPSEPALRRLTVGAFILVLGMPVAWLLATNVLPRYTAEVPDVRWPQRGLARAVDQLATSETGSSARVIAGDSWLAGLTALTSPSSDPARIRPKVLFDGNRRLSPFVTDEDMKDTVVIVAGEGELSPALNALWRSRGAPGFQPLMVPVPGLPSVPPIMLRAAVLTPTGSSTRLAAK